MHSISQIEQIHAVALELSFLVKGPLILLRFYNLKRKTDAVFDSKLQLPFKKNHQVHPEAIYMVFHLHIMMVCSTDNALKRELEKIYSMLKKLKMKNRVFY